MTTEWDGRAARDGLYAVFTGRWSSTECQAADQQQREVLAKILPDLAGCSVLDVGCGIGRLSLWLATCGSRAPFSVVGVDTSAAMVMRATHDVRDPAVRFVCGSATRLPMRDRAWDVMLTSAVLQHLTDDQFSAACSEAARVVRPGGVLVCTEGVAHKYERKAFGNASTKTWRRGVPIFRANLSPAFTLEYVESLRLVEDDYTVLRWTRTELDVA